MRRFRGARLFITGGTGFVGSWILESIRWANRRLALELQPVVLTRSRDAFARSAPHLVADPHVGFVAGDVREIPQTLGQVDAVLHAATPASAALNADDPRTMLDVIVRGGEQALAVAERSGSIPFLFTSSGAVYGRQPPELPFVPETYTGAPDPLVATSAYHEGKRIGELQCALVAKSSRVQPKIARLFAFAGPYLPLDRHYAIGNFIRDGIAKGPIVVGGDGTTVRSYLYAADMVVWLWAIFARGTTLRAYNVGSEHAVDIGTLARTVASRFTPSPRVEIRGIPQPGRVPDRYVPSTSRAREELRVRERVALPDAIGRMIRYAGAVTSA